MRESQQYQDEARTRSSGKNNMQHSLNPVYAHIIWQDSSDNRWVLSRNLPAYAVTQRPGAMMKDVSFGGQLAKLHLNKLAGLWRQTSSPIA